MSKRTANEHGFIDMRGPKHAKVHPADQLCHIMGNWYYQQNEILRSQNEMLQGHVARLSSENIVANRRYERARRANRIASDTVDTLRAETAFKTALIEEIFARFPEVLHEYQWAQAAEVLDGETTEEEEFLANTEM